MDSEEITTGMLSLGAPGVVRWYKSQRREMTRRINDYTANLVAKWPSRFGNLATLPLPDIDGALRELEYSLDTLGADGVILLANVAGRYLGDVSFEPLWAELDRRSVTVLVHPGQPVLAPLAGIASPLIDYPFDVTRAAVQLVLNGVVDRFPNARVILAHAGGFLPVTSARIAKLNSACRDDVRPSELILKSFQRFFFDTALSSGAFGPSAANVTAGEQSLFGSDFPYATAFAGSSSKSKTDVEAYAARPELMEITNEYAWLLFPRLKGQPG
jgi:aminocarboxymuconate-semialdehyde decarboxylase